MHNLLKKVKSLVFKPVLSHEAFSAYFYRLPENIQVKWMRDGQFIVGDITDDKCSYKTQGIDADDFIEMVNDAIYTMYDIPEEYVDAIRSVKTYNPPMAEKEKLENASVSGSIIKLNKRKDNLQLA